MIICNSSSSGEVGNNHASVGEMGRVGGFWSGGRGKGVAADGLGLGRVPSRSEMERDDEVSPGRCGLRGKKKVLMSKQRFWCCQCPQAVALSHLKPVFSRHL